MAGHPPVGPEVDRLASEIVDTAYHVHRALGPTLREKHYQRFMVHALRNRGHHVDQEVAYALEFEGLRIERALRIDLVVDRSIIVEVKADLRPHSEHEGQVLSYLTHTGLPLALLVNLRARYFRQGVRRYVNATPGVSSPFAEVSPLLDP